MKKFSSLLLAIALISKAHAASPLMYDCQLTLEEEVPVQRATMKFMSAGYDYTKGIPNKCDENHNSLCTMFTEDMNLDFLPKTPSGAPDYSKLKVNVSTGTNEDRESLTMALYKTTVQSDLAFTLDGGCVNTGYGDCTLLFKSGDAPASETFVVNAPTVDKSFRAKSHLSFSISSYVPSGSEKNALASLSFFRSIYAGPTPLLDERTIKFSLDDKIEFSMPLTDAINPLETLVDTARVKCKKR